MEACAVGVPLRCKAFLASPLRGEHIANRVAPLLSSGGRRSVRGVRAAGSILRSAGPDSWQELTRTCRAGMGQARQGVPGSVACKATVVGVNPDEIFATADGEECEVVSGQEVVLGEGPPGAPTTPPKADDTKKFCAYLVQPLKNANGTGVLLLPDVFGQGSKETREWAHRLGCFGYSILVPDLHRGTPWDSSRPEDEFEGWRARYGGPLRRIAEDIDTASSYLKAHLAQTQDLQGEEPKMALVGFCFGGGRVLESLARDGEAGSNKFLTGVTFYGTRFDPAAVSKSIKVPVLLITGDGDPYCTVDSVVAVGDRVEGSEVVVFPGRGHGFAHRPANMDDDDDAEAAFQVARHWLHRHLLPDQPQPVEVN